MDQSALSKKLLIKPGHRVAVVEAPTGYRDVLEPLPDGASRLPRPSGDTDVVLVFVANAVDVDKAIPVLAAVKPGGLLWVAYRKGGKKAGTDLNRDILWEQMGRRGLAGTTLVAVDETWSAMRFRPADQVGKQAP